MVPAVPDHAAFDTESLDATKDLTGSTMTDDSSATGLHSLVDGALNAVDETADILTDFIDRAGVESRPKEAAARRA